MRRPVELVLSCEHASAAVPRRYRHVFTGHAEVLTSHEGFDIGAHSIARALGRRFDIPVVAAPVTRLLVDTNRSADNRTVFSRFTRALPTIERMDLLRNFHAPHRDAVEARCATAFAAQRRVLHLSVHSFTPTWAGEARRCDLGFLYDPAHRWEAAICRSWQAAMRSADSSLLIRRNYPYRGTSDGLTRTLRRRFGAADYAGIEIEVNQKWSAVPKVAAIPWMGALAAAIAATLASEAAVPS